MTEAEAHALADKRNAHKGKALWNKVWQPTYSREKAGWTVALVDSAVALAIQAEEKRVEAVNAIRNQGFSKDVLDMAGDALFTACKAHIAAYEQGN